MSSTFPPNPTDRGRAAVEVFQRAMQNELIANEHKGGWDGVPPLTLAADALYHLMKLIHALEEGDKVAILEFAADVGNMAMMAAQEAEALHPEFTQQGPAENYGGVQPEWMKVFPALKALVPDVMEAILPGTERERAIQQALSTVLAREAQHGVDAVDPPVDPLDRVDPPRKIRKSDKVVAGPQPAPSSFGSAGLSLSGQRMQTSTFRLHQGDGRPQRRGRSSD